MTRSPTSTARTWWARRATVADEPEWLPLRHALRPEESLPALQRDLQHWLHVADRAVFVCEGEDGGRWASRSRAIFFPAAGGVMGAGMVPAAEALQRLQEGNARFAANVRGVDAYVTHLRRAELAAGQQPFAIILGCSDSRVPAELVFDQGLGDLFVIRVAGNIVAPSQVGSVEFAAARYGTRLVVVLGHSQCGAVLATLDELRQPTANQSQNLRSIVDRVRPAVEALFATDLRDDPERLVTQAVRANIRASVDHLRHGSKVLEQLIQNEGVAVVGAEYSLETGVVDFFEGVRAD